ncbi:MAG: DNA-directed RNA polymerase sigma-70 factor [Saprospiraceae bacterium]|nr:MAG: DNA-directed RNA polymerase sigma-70 factor [Saprospiraceae bacterium]
MDYASTHRDLIELCKSGNRQAQFELYRLYSKAMYNLCLRMVKNDMDAEDMLQQSFVDVFSKLDSFRYQSSIGAWIKRIAVNNCINFLKKRHLLIEELTENHHEVTDTDPEIHSMLTVDMVKKAMVELPDGYRIVFSLYLLEGYDHKEIGEILGVSEATSKSQYCRARKKLKEVLLYRQPYTDH